MDVLLTCFLLLTLLLSSSHLVSTYFYSDFEITWGNDRAKVLDNGQHLQLSLDQSSSSGFQSKNEYLFGKIDMQIKLVPGNSAGTLTAYYAKEIGSSNSTSGSTYLWFDPTTDFHTYSLLWNPKQIMFSVDGIPVRVFKNNKDLGVAYLKNQAMRKYLSLWNTDEWATRGGAVKIDWRRAPFVASYANFKEETCSASSNCSVNSWYAAEVLESTEQQKLEWVRKNYMIYNYCTDIKRFPQGFPPECTR